MKIFDCFKIIASTTLVLLSLELLADNTIKDKKQNILNEVIYV